MRKLGLLTILLMILLDYLPLVHFVPVGANGNQRTLKVFQQPTIPLVVPMVLFVGPVVLY